MGKLNIKASATGICFLLEDFYPIIHGAAVLTQLLGQRLVQRGIPVLVITRQILKDHPTKDNLNGISIRRVKPVVGLHRLGKYLMMGPALIALIKERNQYNCVIVSDLKVLGILGVFAAKLLGKKCLLSAQSCGEVDGSFATQFGQSASWWKVLIVRRLTFFRNKLLSFADGFVGVSSSITKEFLGSGFSEQSVFRIPNGIEIDKIVPVVGDERERIRKQLGYSKKRYFVFTGRIVKGKGLEYLLRVWEKLVEKYQDIHLILVGSGQGYSLSCEEELKAFVNDNRLAGSVSITGAVYNVSDYLSMADIFVFPSETEGCPMSLLEALAIGLPAIATRIDGITDIVENGESGILVPYGDEKSLFMAMEELLNNSRKAEQLGLAGREIVSEKFDLSVVVEQYVSLINGVTTS